MPPREPINNNDDDTPRPVPRKTPKAIARPLSFSATYVLAENGIKGKTYRMTRRSGDVFCGDLYIEKSAAGDKPPSEIIVDITVVP